MGVACPVRSFRALSSREARHVAGLPIEHAKKQYLRWWRGLPTVSVEVSVCALARQGATERGVGGACIPL